MKSFVFSIILVFFSTYVCALEKMTEPEMKDATAQLASVAGDISGGAAPVTAVAGEAGPIIAPISPVASFYGVVSPHVDPLSQAKETSDTAQPVTRALAVAGDLSALGGFF